MPLKHQDVMVVAVSLLAISSFVGIAFALARKQVLAPAVLRKALHAAVGGWTLLVTPLFSRLGWALVLPAVFVAVNAAPQARPLFQSFAGTPEQRRGLWTFPLGVILAYVLFWDAGNRPAILAGLGALAFADPVAAIVGTRFGQRRYRWFGSGRTVEGSLAFFLVAVVWVGIVACRADHCVNAAFPWRMGIGCGLAGVAIEAITPSGWDNLTIPAAVAAAYHVLA